MIEMKLRLGVGVVLSALMLLCVPGPAFAVLDDAVDHCDAYAVDRTAKTAKVPNANRTFSTSYGHGSILFCGNGTSWGAVHIEVKHTPPSWSVADKCATKIETYVDRGYGSKTTSGSKTTMKLKVGYPSRTATLVWGDNGVITHYMSDGASSTWKACADYS